MSLGNKINSILILFFLMSALSYSEDKITSSPLINLDNIKPSFENLNEENETLILKKNIKEKQKSKNSIKSSKKSVSFKNISKSFKNFSTVSR